MVSSLELALVALAVMASALVLALQRRRATPAGQRSEAARDPGAEVGAGAEAGLGVEAGPGVESGLGVVVDAGVGAGPGAVVDAGVVAGPGMGVGPGTDAGVVAGPGVGVGPGTDAGVVAGPGMGVGTGGAEVGRNLRGLVMGLAVMPLSAWLAMSIAFGASDRPLPVKPPGSASGCGDSSSEGGALLVLIAIGVLLFFQLGPSLVGFLLGRRRSQKGRPLPDGRRLYIYGAILAGASCAVILGRLAMGGVQPDTFTTYGALTPPGAKGWRAEQVIRRQVEAPVRWVALGDGSPLESDTRSSGSCMSMGPHEVPGLKAWIAGGPVNIVYNGSERFLVQPVLDSWVDPARRPHFDRPPVAARGHGEGRWVLRARQADGSLLAVMIYTAGQSDFVFLSGAERRHVGLILCPPVGPLGLVLGLLIAAFLLGRHARGLAASPGPRAHAFASLARLGAGFLLVESAMILYGAYRIYF